MLHRKNTTASSTTRKEPTLNDERQSSLAIKLVACAEHLNENSTRPCASAYVRMHTTTEALSVHNSHITRLDGSMMRGIVEARAHACHSIRALEKR